LCCGCLELAAPLLVQTVALDPASQRWPCRDHDLVREVNPRFPATVILVDREQSIVDHRLQHERKADQLEELFTLASGGEREAFLAALRPLRPGRRPRSDADDQTLVDAGDASPAKLHRPAIAWSVKRSSTRPTTSSSWLGACTRKGSGRTSRNTCTASCAILLIAQ
jgi:hypothetical protein